MKELASLSGQKRGLQRAGPNLSVGSVNADPSNMAASRAAANLIAKWTTMGTKVGMAPGPKST